ncbi:MAG TPA: nuclear transport factor 2 family protein [Niastella sp.]
MIAGIVSGAQAQSKDEAAVTAAVESLRKAMIDGDKAGLQNITADQLSYGHSSGRVEDKASFVDNIATGKSDFVTIDLTNQTISVAGDAAIVRHVLAATTNDGGNPGSVKLNILLVWQKQKGNWKLLARQAVKVP